MDLSFTLKKNQPQVHQNQNSPVIFVISFCTNKLPPWSRRVQRPAAVTGKEKRHATEAHVAPTKARAAATGGGVDLWVCVQVIHTWAGEKKHGFLGKTMRKP